MLKNAGGNGRDFALSDCPIRGAHVPKKDHNHARYGRVVDNAHCDLEVVRRPEGARGFVLLPKRGAGERTFAWL